MAHRLVSLACLSIQEPILVTVPDRAGAGLPGRSPRWPAGAGHRRVPQHSPLRLVIALPEPPVTAPEVLGLDDFGLRRGHIYGTILAGAGTGQAIDVLPGREAYSLSDWLKAHPGARMIWRDRVGAYAEGAGDGADPGGQPLVPRSACFGRLGR
jgi:hypothetical protein